MQCAYTSHFKVQLGIMKPGGFGNGVGGLGKIYELPAGVVMKNCMSQFKNDGTFTAGPARTLGRHGKMGG